MELHFWIEEINNGYTIEYKLEDKYETVYCKNKKELIQRFEELIQFINKKEIKKEIEE